MPRSVLMVAAALLLLAGCATPGADRSWAARGFDFNPYEFAPTDAYGEVSNARAEASAQRFLDARHPLGSPLDAAVADLAHAGAVCRPETDGEAIHVVCRYVRPAHGLSGLVGSSAWRIDLYAAPDGGLARITVSRQLDAT